MKHTLRYIPIVIKIMYRHEKKYLLTLLGEVFCIIMNTFIPMYLLKYTTDALTNIEKFEAYIEMVLFLLGLKLIVAILGTIINNNRPVLGRRLRAKLLAGFFDKCMELDYQMLDEIEILEKKELAQKMVESDAIAKIAWLIISAVSSFSIIIGVLYIVISTNFFVLCFVCFSILIRSILSKTIEKKQLIQKTETIKRNRKLQYMNNLGTDFTYAKDIRIFSFKDKLEKQTNKLMKEIFSLQQSTHQETRVYYILRIFCNLVIQLMIYAILGYQCLMQTITVGTFSLVVNAITQFKNALEDITSLYINIEKESPFFQHYLDFMAYESKSNNKETLPVKQVLNQDNFTIEFKNVSFRYPSQTHNTINNINIKFDSQERISIVGENGAGKTTFVKLLLRLYDPTEGQILLNGVDIKEIAYDDYLNLFATIFQQIKLMAFTIGENISALDLDCDQKRLEQSCKDAQIYNKIIHIDKQFDKMIYKLFDEDGIEFSGGEQQKLALARALYKKNTSIFILDEPTSALDPKAEYEFYKMIDVVLDNKLAFYISHRMSSSKLCSKIILLKQGQIYECGTHNELMKLKGEYCDLYNLQASYYN